MHIISNVYKKKDYSVIGQENKEIECFQSSKLVMHKTAVNPDPIPLINPTFISYKILVHNGY
jgi:hypothetical protein